MGYLKSTSNTSDQSLMTNDSEVANLNAQGQMENEVHALSCCKKMCYY